MQSIARIYVNTQEQALDEMPRCDTISATNHTLFCPKAQDMDIANLLTVADFCQTIGISRSTWHKLKRHRMTPAIVTVGGSRDEPDRQDLRGLEGEHLPLL